MQLSRHRFPRHVRLERRDERKNRLRHWTNGRTPHPREPPRWEVAVDPSAEGRSRRSGERRPVRLRRGLFPLRAQHGRAHRLAAFRAAKWNTRATRDASARVPRFVSEAGRLLKPEGTQNKVPLGHLRELSKHRSIRRPFSSESWSDRRDELSIYRLGWSNGGPLGPRHLISRLYFTDAFNGAARSSYSSQSKMM